MYKNLVLFLFVLFVISCNKEIKEKVNEKSKIEVVLDKILKENPKRDFNSIYASRFDSIFNKEIKLKISENVLDDLPLKLIKVNKYDDKYTAHFSFDNILYLDKNEVLSSLNYDVISEIDGKVALQLKEGEHYLVRGKFKKFLSDDYDKYTKTLCFSDEFKVRKNIIGNNEFLLGITLIEKPHISLYKFSL